MNIKVAAFTVSEKSINMTSIDLHSIFKDKSVISSVPNHVNNTFSINITNLERSTTLLQFRLKFER